MVERRKMISVPQAVAKVMECVPALSPEAVPVERLFGRILAEDLFADTDIPPFDRSAYDGYAVSARDTETASLERPAEFEVVERIAAGQVGAKAIGRFQAARIMTGAPLPAGCDAVVMREWTSEQVRDGKRFMILKRSVRAGENVSLRGEEAGQGALLVRKGVSIDPGIAAVAASMGHVEVRVGRRPIVGVMATGSELAEPGEALRPGLVRNSNAAMLSAQIERAGGVCRYYGRVPDDLDRLLDTYRDMLAECDLLLSTGGVSVGDFDLMPQLFRALGAELLFDKVAMRPGSVTTAARLHGKLLLGLSGNPSACYVGFELFARPAIRAMQLAVAPFPPIVEGELLADYPKPNPFTRFVRARTAFRDGRIGAIPAGFDKSSAVASLAEANCLIVLPGGSRGYRKGDRVQLLLSDERDGAEWPWESR
ncbi:gephyrin-like molybdotransferase Glp [Paenibacillus flagellatus]|uniref:Molybdopterin molybdenumtransferase n=1 Tax=Paenibacillus flagellatus TaxID=2211139 RepID=A0A2V5KBJ3_9BACL|nr:gephyrin-like molybdotransferase Glp [Paenibacillus flagellatus]PYI56921.1 molybdopterin molybdenumtransferase [Paenibacillus flagellatus]